MEPALQRLKLALPSLATVANASCGFLAIVALAQAGDAEGPRRAAAWLLVAGWLLDILDGLLARTLGATSRFGGQLDSLADVLTFGCAPAVLVATSGGSLASCLAGLVYLWGAMLRLARFTAALDDPNRDPLTFTGLPSPAAAVLVAALYLVGSAHWPALPGVAAAVAVLMVSRIPYADLPKRYQRRLLPAWHFLVFAVAAWLVGPPLFLAVSFGLYAISGPTVAGWSRLTGASRGARDG